MTVMGRCMAPFLTICTVMACITLTEAFQLASVHTVNRLRAANTISPRLRSVTTLRAPLAGQL
jgi:hypothetical protein